MQKVTIKAYAVSHKLSIFNVMKMVKSGKLKSEMMEQEGKEITYILLDEEIEDEIKEGIVTVEKTSQGKLLEEMQMLTKEVQLLRAEVEALKKKIY